MEMIILKTFLQLIVAIPALMNRYLALVLHMILLEVVYFCVHLLLMKSMIKFVLDFFMLVQLNELLSIFHQYTVYDYSSSLIKFWLYPIDLSMVNPLLIFIKYQNIKT